MVGPELGRGRDKRATIVSSLAERITSGEYQPGTKLKREEIAVEFGVHQRTVIRVMEDLLGLGLITTERGIGTFVRDQSTTEIGSIVGQPAAPTELPRIPIGLFSDRQWEANTRRLGYTPHISSTIFIGPPGEQVAKRLKLPSDEPTRTEMIARSVAKPHGKLVLFDIRTSSVSEEWAQESMGDGEIWNPDAIAAAGYSEVGEIFQSPSSQKQQETFSIRPNAPMINLLKTIYDENANPFCVSNQIFPAKLGEFRYRRKLQ